MSRGQEQFMYHNIAMYHNNAMLVILETQMQRTTQNECHEHPWY